MGNEYNWTIATLQSSAIPSKPLDVTLVGLQASPRYYPTFKELVDPLETLFTLYNTLKCLLNVVYHVQQATPNHGCCLPFATIPPSLQTTTFKCCPFFLLLHIGCYLPMASNSLLLQKLPHGMPSCFLLYKKCNTTMEKVTYIVYS